MAGLTPSINLQPVTANLEVVGIGDTFQAVFYVASHQILRCTALDTKQVVMVSPVAKLVVQITILQQNPAQCTGLNQNLQGPINRGPAYAR